MRGYVIQEKGRADWRDVLVPELGPYDALVRLTAVATCTTDVHLIDSLSLSNALGKAGLHDPSPGAPPVVRGPSAARRCGAATALPSTRLHCSPRFSHHLDFLPIFPPQARPPTCRAARIPLRGRGFEYAARQMDLSLPSWSCGFDSRHPLSIINSS